MKTNMKKSAIIAIILMTALSAPVLASAAQKVYLSQVVAGSATRMNISVIADDNGSMSYHGFDFFPPVTYTTEKELADDLKEATADWANNSFSWSITANDVLNYAPAVSDLAYSGNFADIQSKPTTYSGYGITDVQPLDSDLTAVAAVATTSFGRGLLDDADAAAARTSLGLATVASTGSYNDLSDKPTIGAAWEGTTQHSNAIRIYKNATVASGTAAFHLTTDGLSGGTAICPTGIIQDSIDVEVNDATASYQMSYAVSNGDKTITVTANKLTTANILTGILGQTQANGSVVRLSVECY